MKEVEITVKLKKSVKFKREIPDNYFNEEGDLEENLQEFLDDESKETIDKLKLFNIVFAEIAKGKAISSDIDLEIESITGDDGYTDYYCYNDL